MSTLNDGHTLSRREFLKLGSALAGLAILPPLSSSLEALATQAQTSEKLPLEGFIYDRMAAAHVPGLALCLIKRTQIIAAHGYGWAHVAQRIPVTAHTDFMLASVSKTITATAVMQLSEAGAFDLDDDVNGYLPFAIRNPHYPDDPITFRQLLTHTSSIQDNWTVLNLGYTLGDSPIPLGDFLAAYLVPGGRIYNLDRNFYSYPPGTAWNYCNVAVALVGYLVEAITGIPFDQYCSEKIFVPLPMRETSWRLAELHRENVAMPYHYRFDSHDFIPYGQYGYPDYPDGLLRTSVSQLAHHLIAFMNNGTYHGVQILQPDTVAEMRKVQYPAIDPTQGLIWYYDQRRGDTLLGHNGGDLGVATAMFYRPADGVGVILLANGEGLPPDPLYDIQDALFELAEQIHSSDDLDHLSVPAVSLTDMPSVRRSPQRSRWEKGAPDRPQNR